MGVELVVASGDQFNYHKHLKSTEATYYAVVTPGLTEHVVNQVRGDLAAEMCKYPEFIKGPCLAGGTTSCASYASIVATGAQHVPSSFHNITVRHLRQWIMSQAVLELWSDYITNYYPDFQLQQGYSPLHVVPHTTADSHQPVPINIGEPIPPDASDTSTHLYFYGFVNLNAFPMCATIKMANIIVPPGHILTTGHRNYTVRRLGRVNPTHQSPDMFWLQLSWHITNNKTSSNKASTKESHKITTLTHMMDTQAVMFTDFTGQKPMVFVNTENSNHLVEAATPHIRQLLTTTWSGQIATQSMESLELYGLKMHPGYTNMDRAIHITPNRTWTLLQPGSATTSSHVQL